MAKKKSRWQEWGWLFVAIAISLVVVLMLAMAQFRFEIANPLVLVGLLPIFPLGFIALDLVTYGIRKKENAGQNLEVKMSYQPNLQIWGLGLILGVGMVVLYLLGTVTSALLNNVPASNLALVQNIALLVLLGVSLGFIIWAIVRICQQM